MAGKAKSVYVCSECGYEAPRWLGQCPECKAWNTMTEEIKAPASPAQGARANKAADTTGMNMYALRDIHSDREIRYKTGMSELDRVLGGGLVNGSLVLLSGDPGIGKSTILLQICEYLGSDKGILYISGEESHTQIKLRADRLGVTTENLYILCETDIQRIGEFICDKKPDVVIVDSIQTMNFPLLQSSPGSVAQVRECSNVLLRVAKNENIPIIVVGHVNKDGNIAGPKVLEHIVDAVLYFEGDRNLSFRILRAVKNRFGSTNEIGVFEMLDKGLSQVLNPSEMLITGRPKGVSGSCITAVMEGSRPILAEIQALVTPTAFGNPRRMSTGYDYNRLAMILAVLEKRSGYFFSNEDAYVNVVGGLRIDEPATDLTVAMALISSLKDVPLSDKVIAFGEVGLAGEVRGVSSCEQRVIEAARMGFTRCIIPRHNLKNISRSTLELTEIIGVNSVRRAFEIMNE